MTVAELPRQAAILGTYAPRVRPELPWAYGPRRRPRGGWQTTTEVWVGEVREPLAWWAGAWRMTPQRLIVRLETGWDLLDALSAPAMDRGTFGAWHFALDPAAQDFVDRHPEGASLDDIGELLGVSKERVRQIEADGLANLARRKELEDAVLDDRAASWDPTIWAPGDGYYW